jgi:Glycosyl hydrolase catalytic core
MVPATMCRKAMVAVLCAVVVVAVQFAVLASAPVAYANDPLSDAIVSDAQPLDSASGSAADAPSDGSVDPPLPPPAEWWDDWFADDLGPEWSFEDLLAGEWSLDDWYAGGDAQAPDDQALALDAGSADALLADVTALAGDVLDPPVLTVSGTTLSWVPAVPVSSYVFVRKVPGLAPQYTIVSGTTHTPAPVPGTTVSYSVRANVAGSAWAPEVSISYPAEAVDETAAPRLTVSGTTLQWTRVGTIDRYVFVRKVPGLAAQYSTVSGTSLTPAAVPGATVSYSVRTAVTGSAWAPEVSITYPAGTTTPPPTQPVDGSFQMGIVAGSALSYELPFVRQLGARTARMEFGAGTSASSMAGVIDAYARAGIRPLLLATFYGRLPTAAEAQNVASWAAAYGPGGTFWQGKTYPAGTAVTRIEFGNETSYSYQWADNSLATYATRAQTYALRAREAAIAIRAANPNVGLLAIADNAVNGTAWVANMFRAVPNIDDQVAGWTVHPYGPNWASRIDSTVNSARTAGARDVPIWITEWGLSTDNGRCLDDNYGFDRCMTYAEAATTLRNVLTGMTGRYGSRLAAFFLYQAHDQHATGVSTGRERYFGALQSNAAAKGGYTTEVKATIAVN